MALDGDRVIPMAHQRKCSIDAPTRDLLVDPVPLGSTRSDGRPFDHEAELTVSGAHRI